MTQAAFLLCDGSRTVLDVLIADVMGRLAEQEATILLYGVTLKRREGFVVVQAKQGIPRGIEQELRARPDVFECVVYDVPSVEHEEAEVAPILLALRQALQDLMGFPTEVAAIRSAFQRISLAVIREEAAIQNVTQACSKGVRSPDDEQEAFFALLWINDACEGAIQELFQVAALWQQIGDDALASAGVHGTAIQSQCLRQRQRVTRRLLGIMDIQRAAEQKQERLHVVPSGRTEAEQQQTEGGEPQ